MATQAEKERAEDPSTPSPAYEITAPRLSKMRAVLGGTETMRAKGEEYLPRFSLEEVGEYESRLAKSYFYNATDLTLAAWVGKVFSEPLKYAGRPGAPYLAPAPDLPSLTPGKTLPGAPALVIPPPPSIDPRIKDLFSDIDLQGNSIDVFAREWFHTGVGYGLAPMMVFLTTPLTTPAPGQRRTKKDDQKEAIRAYWRHIAPENVLDCRVSEQGGRQIVSHLRVLGVREDYVGFSTVLTPTITVYEPFQSTVWLRVKTRNGKVKWMPETTVANDYPEVPFVVFYTEKEDTMVGRSPSLHLADINIRHWQSYSAQTNCLEVARFPILAGSGVPDDQNVKIGNRQMLRSEIPEAKFYYVEHSGASLAAGEHDLDKLENWMSAYGSSFLKKKVSHVTAVDSVLATSEATSSISDVACRFNDALSAALYHTAKLMGAAEPEMGALTVRSDFTSEQTAPTDPSSNKDRKAAGSTGKQPQPKNAKTQKQ